MNEITKIIITIFLIIFAGAIMYEVGLNQGINNNCNSKLFTYKCDDIPTLDYEFNCHNKFINITGIYCIENQTDVIKCANEIRK
jgi:hypothetical protein